MVSPSFPGALDALANPGPTTETDDTGYELDIVIARLQNCVMAIENKLGIGASTPGASAAVLRRTASGASAWGQVTAADIASTGGPMLLYTTGVLVSNTASISIISISQAYAHLELRIFGRSTGAGNSVEVVLRVNNDSTALYFGEVFQANGTNVAALQHGPTTTYARCGYIPPTGATASSFGTVICTIPNYTSAAYSKSMVGQYFYAVSDTTGNAIMGPFGMEYWGGVAVTRLDLTPVSGSWASGSIVSLYGWN